MSGKRPGGVGYGVSCCGLGGWFILVVWGTYCTGGSLVRTYSAFGDQGFRPPGPPYPERAVSWVGGFGRYGVALLGAFFGGLR